MEKPRFTRKMTPLVSLITFLFTVSSLFATATASVKYGAQRVPLGGFLFNLESRRLLQRQSNELGTDCGGDPDCSTTDFGCGCGYADGSWIDDPSVGGISANNAVPTSTVPPSRIALSVPISSSPTASITCTPNTTGGCNCSDGSHPAQDEDGRCCIGNQCFSSSSGSTSSAPPSQPLTTNAPTSPKSTPLPPSSSSTPPPPSPTVAPADPPAAPSCVPNPTDAVKDSHEGELQKATKFFCSEYADNTVTTSNVNITQTIIGGRQGFRVGNIAGLYTGSKSKDDVYDISVKSVDGCTPNGGYDLSTPVLGNSCPEILHSAWKQCMGLSFLPLLIPYPV